MWWQWLALGLGFFAVGIGFFIYKKKQESAKAEQEANKPLQKGAPPEKEMLDELLTKNPKGNNPITPAAEGEPNNNSKKPTGEQQPNLSPEMIQQLMQSMGGGGAKKPKKKEQPAEGLYKSKPLAIKSTEERLRF